MICKATKEPLSHVCGMYNCLYYNDCMKEHEIEQEIALRKQVNSFNNELLDVCPFCGKKVAKLYMDSDLDFGDSARQVLACCNFRNGGCGATGGYANTVEQAVLNWNQRVYDKGE